MRNDATVVILLESVLSRLMALERLEWTDVREITMRHFASGLLLCTLSGLGIGACGKEDETGDREVVVYTALDRSFSEPILDEFTRRTGIKVKAAYDTESTKSVGLANRIRQERDRPRCDVHWNNEILNTLRLKEDGLLEPCSPSEAENYPAAWKDPEGYWYGFAARARVIIVNTDLVMDKSFPTSIHDLSNPAWKSKTGIAKPLFGTTASHVACLFAALGQEKATGYLDSIKNNDVQIKNGNKGCATSVAGGHLAFAMTDTDDAIIELEAGRPVRIVYPDIGEDEMGTLFLPNTVAIVKGAPHREEAAELVDYLLSAEVEKRLAAGPSAQIPLNKQAEPNPRVKGPSQVKAMEVDFSAAGEAFDRARAVVEKRFLK